MLITLIFAILGIVLLVGGAGSPQARDNPSIRIGLWFLGAVGIILALVFLIAAL